MMTALHGQDLIAELERRAPSDDRLTRLFGSFRRSMIVVVLRKLRKLHRTKVDLPWGHQFIGVLPESVSSLLWRFGCYEVATSVFVVRNLAPGGCFVDIGAHFGYFTLLASHVVGQRGRVVAIEAMPETFGMLQANIRANGIENVTMLNNAAAAERCTLTFKDFGIVNSSLNTSALPRGAVQNASKDVRVDAQAADHLLAEAGVVRVDMIKIDAESSEEQVIRGLHDTNWAACKTMPRKTRA
jgi:FkbM family methyltransferase